MTNLYTDEYWSSEFDITQDDLTRVAERLERDGSPQDLKSIALRIVRGRIEHGQDYSPAVFIKITGKQLVRLWDPAGQWQIGDTVLVATFRKNSPFREAFLGEIVIESYQKEGEKDKTARIKIPELDEEKDFILRPAGSKEAIKWHEAVREVVKSKLRSSSINQQAEGIILKHGERILSRLAETLQLDSRFTMLEGKWYVTEKLPRIGGEDLQTVHRALVQNPSITEKEILSVVRPDTQTDKTLLRMAVHTALEQMPERFENTGTPARPQWKARLPEPGQAEVTHYAYDPETYLILCRPGQRLNQKNAQRLQELNLYSRVVTFAE
jgi:hypothetical protein